MDANKPQSRTPLLDQAIAWLQNRLPSSWRIEESPTMGPERQLPTLDSKITLTAPNGIGRTIAIEEKQAVSPRVVLDLLPRVETARKMGAYLPLLVIAPWLGKRSQSLLAEHGINYLDLTGNALLRIEDPPLYLQTMGAERNPTPKPRGQAQLRGAKAARLIRLLVDVSPPYGVRELAKGAGLAPGYVSRLLDTLYREALVERSPRGPVESVDVAGLLRRWASSYDVFKSNRSEGFIAPEGVDRLLTRWSADPRAGTRIAITGSVAAARLAPIASPSLLLAYDDAPATLASQFNLLPADEGANVLLLRPFDSVAFSRTSLQGGLRYASPSQVAVDCLTGNGRMPAEGEALLNWMRKDEPAWRLPSLQALYSSGQ